MSFTVDYLIIGSGFAGLTIAERLATQCKKTSLIIERRNHLGGNAYDHYDANGVLIHAYGPHYFRTNSLRIRDYLSRFTKWHPVDYKIFSYTDNRYWNFPINLNTFEQFLGRASTTQEMEEWLLKHRVKIESPKNSEEVIISQIGWELYEKFFKGYTIKQWKRHPRDLDASVCGRIPIRTNRDDRYLREEFQALPADGYTKMFENMIEACGPFVDIQLNTDYRDIKDKITFKHLIYTGAIDEYFNHCYGHLPYRSLRFKPQFFTKSQLGEREHISGKPNFWQPAMQVNYPNEQEYTRIVEIKHATGQLCENTTIVYEYPDDYEPGKEAYYPIPAPDAMEIYQRYKILADCQQNVSFIGRLATYRYYNMDQIVGMALAEFMRLEGKKFNCSIDE